VIVIVVNKTEFEKTEKQKAKSREGNYKIKSDSDLALLIKP